MRDVEPDCWRNLREELAAGRQWVDRSVVFGSAALTGWLAVGFTLLAEAGSHGFEQVRSTHVLAPWLKLTAFAAKKSRLSRTIQAVQVQPAPGNPQPAST